MWRRVDLVWTEVSEEHIASIFRVEKSASEESAWACVLLPHIILKLQSIEMMAIIFSLISA
jgi:hypothetical protein